MCAVASASRRTWAGPSGGWRRRRAGGFAGRGGHGGGRPRPEGSHVGPSARCNGITVVGLRVDGRTALLVADGAVVEADVAPLRLWLPVIRALADSIVCGAPPTAH